MANYKNGVLHLKQQIQFDTKEINLVNLRKAIKKVLSSELKIPENLLETQLLSNEFIEITLYDFYGNSYTYDLKYLENTNNKLLIRGSVGDTNNVFFGIDGYKKIYGTNSMEFSTDLINPMNSDSNKFKYGFFDRSTRSVPVVTDNTDSFLQANKNAIDNQIESFKENKRLMEQTNALNRDKTLANNEFSMANLDYQGQTNLTNSLLSGANSLLSLPFNPVGSVMSLAGTGLNYMQSANNLDRLKNNQQQLNELSLEGVTLSALQSKTAFNQGIRSFNARLKDLDNQPVSIANIGSDLSMQLGARLDGIYIDIKIPNKNALLNAYDYFRLYGVIQNTHYNNISKILDNRKDFNYIKMTTVSIKDNDIPQKHLNMLRSILLSGIRVWKYKENIDFKNYNVKNEDIQ